LDGSRLFEEVNTNRSDILVLDISMQKTELKMSFSKGLSCKVIILFSHDDLKIIKHVMKLGASGYLTKQCAGETLWKRFSPFLMEGLFLYTVRKNMMQQR
jgi:DNA-binding NarL/FixJ family response regulator